MRRCPSCDSGNLHLSKTKGYWEQLRRRLTGKRPYRCHTCGRREWSPDLGPQFHADDVARAAQALAPAPPDLDAVEIPSPNTHDKS